MSWEHSCQVEQGRNQVWLLWQLKSHLLFSTRRENLEENEAVSESSQSSFQTFLKTFLVKLILELCRQATSGFFFIFCGYLITYTLSPLLRSCRPTQVEHSTKDTLDYAFHLSPAVISRDLPSRLPRTIFRQNKMFVCFLDICQSRSGSLFIFNVLFTCGLSSLWAVLFGLSVVRSGTPLFVWGWLFSKCQWTVSLFPAVCDQPCVTISGLACGYSFRIELLLFNFRSCSCLLALVCSTSFCKS